MNKTAFVAAALLGAALWIAGPAVAGGCKGGCPCQIKGAEKTVTNTAEGVTITITAKDPAVVKQIQEAAAKMKEGGCEKCKPGCKCPKCAKKAKGAKAEEKKEEKK